MLQNGLSHWVPDPRQEPPLRELTIADLLDEAVARNADGEALVYSAYESPDLTLRLTYRELLAEVERVAAALIGTGLAPGDRLVVWSTSTPHHPLLQLGAAYAGLTLVPVNPLYRRDELRYVLEIVAPRAVFALADDGRVALWEILDAAADGLDGIDTRVVLGSEERPGGTPWRRWLDAAGGGVDAAAVRARRAAVEPGALAQIQFTSGTTGFPKGVELTHRVIANQGIQMAACAGTGASDRVVNPMPQFHCGGCIVGGLSVLAAAATHLPIVTFDPDAICRTVEAERATMMLGVPTMLLAVDAEAARAGRDLDSLHVVITGGSPVPAAIGRGWQERLGVSFVITYGQTEHGPLAAVTTPRDAPELQISTVGRPIPHCELDVVAPGTTDRVGVGVEGELRYRGYVMRGYHRDQEATARAVDAGGWLRSGDLGTIDADGYVRITGRAKEMIIRGGENIAPAMVEDVVRALDQVADVCVVGVPDATMGEELCAFVRLRPGATLTAAEMRELLLGRVARFKIPRYLVLLDAFPLTPSGKIQRFRLQQQFDARLAAGSVDDSKPPVRA